VGRASVGWGGEGGDGRKGRERKGRRSGLPPLHIISGYATDFDP